MDRLSRLYRCILVFPSKGESSLPSSSVLAPPLFISFVLLSLLKQVVPSFNLVVYVSTKLIVVLFSSCTNVCVSSS